MPRVGSTTTPTFKELSGPDQSAIKAIYEEMNGLMETEGKFVIWDMFGSDAMDMLQSHKSLWSLMSSFHHLRRLLAKHRMHIAAYVDPRNYQTKQKKAFTTWAIVTQCKSDGSTVQGLLMSWRDEPLTMDIINVPPGYLNHFGD